jgi:hypothetical protein
MHLTYDLEEKDFNGDKQKSSKRVICIKVEDREENS